MMDSGRDFLQINSHAFLDGMLLEHLLPEVWLTGATERHSVVRTQNPLGAGQGQVLHGRVHPWGESALLNQAEL